MFVCVAGSSYHMIHVNSSGVHMHEYHAWRCQKRQSSYVIQNKKCVYHSDYSTTVYTILTNSSFIRSLILLIQFVSIKHLLESVTVISRYFIFIFVVIIKLILEDFKS